VIEHFERPDGLGPVNGYSHVVAGTGRLVAVSGQLPVDADGHVVDPSDPLVQARQVFRNLGTALKAAGATPADVIKLTFYTTDIGDLHAIRAARDECLDGSPSPASSVVQVTALVLPETRIEIDALAVTSPKRKAGKK
jgi:enamine deaminase RidA (YjgF/YER057c/UK114 family)